jgi:prophage regulatory protein
MAKVLLRLPAVIERTGSTTSDIYEGMKAGTFPQSVPIGKCTVGWLESEVEAWIDSRVALRDQRLRESGPAQRKGGPGRGHKGPMRPAVQANKLSNKEAEPAKGPA